MLLKVMLIVVAMIALAAFELWMFWSLGEREDRRRPHEAGERGT
jgi:flagellar basal body-associated protein FliL